jgi:DNA primase
MHILSSVSASCKTESTTIEDVRRAIPMRDLVAQLGLGPVNREGNIRCPNPEHGDRNPSCHVYGDHVFCFSCGFRADAIDLVRRNQNCDFWSAATWICGQAGIDPLRRDPEIEARYQARAEISATLEQVWVDALRDPGPAIAYLESRGIPRNISGGRIGCLPADYRPPDPEAAARAGLFSKGGHFLLAGRCVFPVLSSGRVVACYGRSLSDDLQPKHVTTGSTDPPMPTALCGLNEAKGSEVYLCEAPIDGLTLVARGLPAVSTTGAGKLTEEHVRLLVRRNINRVVLCFDADDAGKKGARRAGQMLFRAGISVRVLEFPEECAA